MLYINLLLGLMIILFSAELFTNELNGWVLNWVYQRVQWEIYWLL